MSYNYDEIREENWPFKIVLKAPNYFVFGDQVVEFKTAHKYSDHIEFIDERLNTLKYSEVDYLICIEYSNYILKCINKCNITEPIPYNDIEHKPTFMGENASAFHSWVSNRLSFPEEARDFCAQGCVMIKFIIKADGSVNDLEVTQSLDPILDKEAVKLVSSSPKWTPGTIDKKPVNVVYTIPVIFQLR